MDKRHLKNFLPPGVVRTTPRHERGLALITAMLVVAIAATTAVYLSFNQQIWLRQAQNLSDRAQSDVVRAGGEEWAIIILEKDAKDAPQSDNLTEDWAKPLPLLPVESGQLTGKIYDAQARFNINNLVNNNAPSPQDAGIFRHLLESLKIDPNLTEAVVDWIDADSETRPYGAEDIEYLQMKTPYRAANQLLQSVEELRLVRGFTPEIVEKLRPYITALPQRTEININTAEKEVLGALFYTMPGAVEQILSTRPHKDTTALTKIFPPSVTPPSYSLKSSFFEIEIETQFGHYQRATQALVQRGVNGGATNVLWHRQRLPTKMTALGTATDEKPGAAPEGNI
jgi:general secretion pathway protein K